MPAHGLQTEVSYQEVDRDEPLQKNILIGLRVDGDKTSRRRWLSSAEEAGMHEHHSTTPEHIQAALGNAQEGEEKKHRGRARSYTTQSHSPELILLVTKKVSQFGRNLQLADKR